jgi:hypothetical protein
VLILIESHSPHCRDRYRKWFYAADLAEHLLQTANDADELELFRPQLHFPGQNIGAEAIFVVLTYILSCWPTSGVENKLAITTY